MVALQYLFMFLFTFKIDAFLNAILSPSLFFPHILKMALFRKRRLIVNQWQWCSTELVIGWPLRILINSFFFLSCPVGVMKVLWVSGWFNAYADTFVIFPKNSCD